MSSKAIDLLQLVVMEHLGLLFLKEVESLQVGVKEVQELLIMELHSRMVNSFQSEVIFKNLR